MESKYFESLLWYVNEGLFFLFEKSTYLLTFLTILSLILLIIGQVVKSQKMKIKFLRYSIFFILLLFFILLVPIIYIKFKNLV